MTPHTPILRVVGGSDDVPRAATASDAPTGQTWVMAALPFEESLSDVLDAWARHGIAAGHSDRTIGSRRYTVLRLATAGIDPLTADREDLTRWLAELTDRTGGPAKRSSRATYRAQLRAFYSWLQDVGRRDDDPSARLPRPRVSQGQPRPLSQEDVERVLAACSDPRARQTKAYMILAAYAGLRVHEIAKFRGEDIEGHDLRVIGKGGHEATVPLHPRVQALADRMRADGWWFPSDAPSGHVHRCSVSSAISRAMHRAGVAGTPHAARHFYGTQVLRASGGDLRTAQRALRHQSITSTAIYTQVADDTLRHAIEGIPAA